MDEPGLWCKDPRRRVKERLMVTAPASRCRGCGRALHPTTRGPGVVHIFAV